MARLSLAPDLPLILCFRLIAAGDSPPVFRPVPPLDFTFGGRATDRRSSPPLLPPLPSPSPSGKLRKRLVVRGSRVRLCATDMRMRGCAPSIVYSISVSDTGVTRQRRKARYIRSFVSLCLGPPVNTCIDMIEFC